MGFTVVCINDLLSQYCFDVNSAEGKVVDNFRIIEKLVSIYAVMTIVGPYTCKM